MRDHSEHNGELPHRPLLDRGGSCRRAPIGAPLHIALRREGRPGSGEFPQDPHGPLSFLPASAATLSLGWTPRSGKNASATLVGRCPPRVASVCWWWTTRPTSP